MNMIYKTGKLILFAVCLCMLTIGAAAQDTENPQENKTPLRDRIFFGGNLGAQFGSSTYLDISPLVGYKITDRLHAGIGATYIYFDAKVEVFFSNSSYVTRYQTSHYGGRIFSRYYIYENFFGHAEFEWLNVGIPQFYNNPRETKIYRDDITSLLVGGGYMQELGRNAGIIIMALWNLTEEPNSPYDNPVIRIGFTAGF